MEFKIILACAYNARHRPSTVIHPVPLRCYDPFFWFPVYCIKVCTYFTRYALWRSAVEGVGVVVIGVSLPLGLGLVLT